MFHNKWPSQYFDYNFFSFWSLELVVFLKDAPSNSLQNHNRTYFCSKLRNQIKRRLSDTLNIPNFPSQRVSHNEWPTFVSIFLLSSTSILKAKYTIRRSVKSSTNYSKNHILYMHSLFSKWTTFCAINFRRCQENHFSLRYEFVFSYLILLSSNVFY